MADAVLRFDTKIDTSNMDKGLKSIADSASKAFGSLAKSAGMAVAALSGAALAASTKYIYDAMRASSEFEQQTVKLTATMRNSIGASDDQVKSMINLAAAQEKLGVVSKTSQVAGLGELATYVEKQSSLEKLLPAMNDYISYQYGVNASSEAARQIATGMGKALQGQFDIFSKQGFKLSEAQKETIKYGNEQQRVAVIAQIVQESLGGVNEALKQTDAGRMFQLGVTMDDVKLKVGELANRIKTDFIEGLVPAVDTLAGAFKNLLDGTGSFDQFTDALSGAISDAVQKIAEYAPKVAEVVISFVKSAAQALYDNRYAIVEAAAEIGASILAVIFGADIVPRWNKFVSEIAAALTTFANVAGAVLKPVAAIIEATFGFILNHGNRIVAVIVGIGGAFAVVKAINTWNDAVKNVKKTIDDATKAMTNEAVASAKAEASRAKAAATIANETAKEKDNTLAKAKAALASAQVNLAKTQEAEATARNTACLEGETAAFARHLATKQSGSEAAASLLIAKNAEKAAIEATTQSYELEAQAAAQAKTVMEMQANVASASAASEAANTAATEANTAAQAANIAVTKAGTEEQNANNISMTIGQALIAALSGQLTLKTAATIAAATAQKALNAAMSMMPTMLASAAIGVLVSLFTELTNKGNEASAEMRAVAEASEKLNQSIKQSKQDYDNQIAAMETNAAVADDLLAKITTLSNVENRSAEQKSLLAGYVNQLNSIYPDLNLQYSTERDTLSLTSSELVDQLKNRQAIINMKATEARQLEIAKEIYELEKNLVDKEKEREETQKRYTEALKATYISSIIAAAMPAALASKLEALDKEIANNKDNVISLRKENEGLTNSYLEAANAADELGGDTDDLNDDVVRQKKELSGLISSLSQASKQYADIKSAQDYSAESAASLTAEYLDLVESNKDMLKQYPELYASIDKNNTAQQNAANIAEAVCKIRRQALIDEMNQQLTTVYSNIYALKIQRDAALKIYEQIAAAAGVAMAASTGIGQTYLTAEESLKNAQAQADGLREMIKNIEAETVPTITKAGGGAAKETKSAFDSAKDAISEYRDTLEYTKQGELKMWEELLEKYGQNAKERVEIEKNVRQLTDGIRKDKLDKFKAELDEEQFYDLLSTEEKLRRLNEILTAFEEGTDERKQLEREIYSTEKQLSKEGLDDFKKTLDEKKHYDQLSKEDELSLWRDMRAQYAEGSDERAEIDRQVYSLKKQLAQDAYKHEGDLIKSLQNDLKSQEKDDVLIQSENSREKLQIVSKEYLERIRWVKEENSVIDDAIHQQMAAEFDRSRQELENIRAEKQEIIDKLSLSNEGLYKELQSIQAERDAMSARQQAERDAAKEQSFADKEKTLRDKMATASAEDLVKIYEDLASLEKDKSAWKQELVDREAANALAAREKEIRAEISENMAKAKTAAQEVNDETQRTVELLTKAMELGSAGAITLPISLKWLDDDFERLQSLGFGTIGKVAKAAADAGKTVAESVSAGITNNLSEIMEPAGNIIKTAITAMTDKLPEIKPFVRGMYDEFKTRINDQSWSTLGYNMVMGIVQGVYAGGVPLGNALLEIIQSALAASANYLGIASPAKRTMSDGANIVLGYVVGIEKATPKLTSAINGLSAEMLAMPLSALGGGYNTRMPTLSGNSSVSNSSIVYNVNVTESPPMPISRMDEHNLGAYISRLVRRVGI